jgi:signal peptidase
MKVFLLVFFFTLVMLFSMRPYLLVGWSMYPTIGPVALAYCDGNNFTVNDIILFKWNGKLIAHRVIAIEKDTVIAKGDNNPSNMIEVLKKDDVICKVKVVGWGR